LSHSDIHAAVALEQGPTRTERLSKIGFWNAPLER
jgi:hypothetical protein